MKMVDSSVESVTGGPSEPAVAPKGRRFAADWVDLVLIPIFLGGIAGFLLLEMSEGIRNVFLILLNITWIIFRDAVFSPGRRFEWRRVINIIAVPVSIIGFSFVVVSKITPPMAAVFFVLVATISIVVLIFDKAGAGANLELVSLTGEKVTLGQAFIRNIFLVTPLVLTTGYCSEIMRVFVSSPAAEASRTCLIWRRIVYGILLLFVLFSLPTVIASKNFLIIIGTIGTLAVPIIFFLFDKAGLSEGNRLMDVYARTRVIQA